MHHLKPFAPKNNFCPHSSLTIPLRIYDIKDTASAWYYSKAQFWQQEQHLVIKYIEHAPYIKKRWIPEHLKTHPFFKANLKTTSQSTAPVPLSLVLPIDSLTQRHHRPPCIIIRNYICRWSFYPNRLSRTQRVGMQTWSCLCCPQDEGPETGKQERTNTEISRPFPWSLFHSRPVWTCSSCVTVKWKGFVFHNCLHNIPRKGLLFSNHL